MTRIAQFNDGLGWRGNRTVPADAACLDTAIEFAKEHQSRWPKDNIRLIEGNGPTASDWKVIWSQEGSAA